MAIPLATKNLLSRCEESITNLLDATASECTMPESMGEDSEPSWLALLNRVGEDTVERLMSRLSDVHAELQHYHGDDLPYGPNH